MPKSEIDDIFASKGKAKPGPSIASTSTASPPPEKKKKKKDKKRQREEDVAPVAAAPEAKVARKAVPETIVDPSLGIASTASSAKQLRSARTAEGAPKVKKAKTSKADAGREDEERFKDSRGTGPRRKTEEGFSIYKEDELGMSSGGGDTPLCPFDCECCF